MKKRRGLWLGGYVSGDGVYVIAKRVSGHRFHISTRCTSKEAAMVQLRRFQANPGAYSPAGDVSPKGLVLNEALIEAHFKWTKVNIGWESAKTYRNCLFDWADDLKGKDLRRLRLVEDLKGHLVGKKSVPHRIKAIKSLYTWLVEEQGAVGISENPTVGLKVRKGKPAQFHGQVYVEWERFVKVLPHLDPATRDVFVMLSGTGWHLTEIQRFAKEGVIRKRRDTDPPQVVGVLAVAQHKTGSIHVTNIVRAEHFDAACRIRDRGHVPGRSWVLELLNRAVAKVNDGVPESERITRFTPRQLRHSVATWLVQSGLSPQAAGEYVGHMDPRTTRRHYVDMFEGAVVLQPSHLRVIPGGG